MDMLDQIADFKEGLRGLLLHLSHNKYRKNKGRVEIKFPD